MRFLSKAINHANRIASILSGSLILLIGGIVCYAVVMRYLLNKPIGWGEEVSTYLMIWAAFLGAGYTMQMDGHIGVDVIVGRLPARAQKFLGLGKDLVGIAFLTVLTVKGLEECALSMKLGQTSISELSIPMVIPHLSVPAGAILLGLQVVVKSLTRLLSEGDPGETAP
jgi:TRAP-type C4-dicarboxylate transport system permease small subunit